MIDNASTDLTAEVARQAGVHHIIYLPVKGLAGALYRPLRVFTALSALMILGGLALGIRYLCFVLNGQGAGHIQSVILAAVLWIVGFQLFLIGLEPI